MSSLTVWRKPIVVKCHVGTIWAGADPVVLGKLNFISFIGPYSDEDFIQKVSQPVR